MKKETKKTQKQKNKEELQLINQQMKDSIQLIRKSKLGDKKGTAALYELPWYMVMMRLAHLRNSSISDETRMMPTPCSASCFINR